MIQYLLDPPPGFFYFTNFLSVEEEQNLLQLFNQIKWETVSLYGITAKRRVKHYGLTYKYDNRTVLPTEPPPPFIDPLIQRASHLLNQMPEELKEILITEYPIGAGIGWHRDAPVFKDKVFGISLGAHSTMKLRKRDKHSEVYKIDLAPRAAYIISGVASKEWEHSILPVKALRYSITFRSLVKN